MIQHSKGQIIAKIIFFIAFIILTTFSLLFAKGFRFDFSSRQFIHTGILDVSSHPLGAGIFLDGEFIDFTYSFLRFIPLGKTNLRLEKSDFKPWGKIIEINDQRIVKIAPLLIPKDMKKNIKVLGDSKHVFKDPQNRGIIILYPHLNSLYIIDFILQKEKIYEFSKKIKGISFDDKFNVILPFEDKKKSFNFFTKQEVSLNFMEKKSRLSPEGKFILTLKKNSLWKFNTKSKKMTKIKTFKQKIEEAFWFPQSQSIIVVLTNQIRIIDSDGQNNQIIFYKDDFTLTFFLEKLKKIFWQEQGLWKSYDF